MRQSDIEMRLVTSVIWLSSFVNEIIWPYFVVPSFSAFVWYCLCSIVGMYVIHCMFITHL